MRLPDNSARNASSGTMARMTRNMSASARARLSSSMCNSFA